MEKSAIIEKFKKSGIKSGEKKIKIYQEILKSKNTFDAITLYENLKGSLDRATLYRAISQFKEKNLIRETANIDGKQFYEKNSQKAHPHFICVVCKDVSCIEQDLDLDLDLGSKTVESISININGTCEKCQ